MNSMKLRHTGALALALASVVALSAALAPAAFAEEPDTTDNTAVVETVAGRNSHRKGRCHGGGRAEAAEIETAIGKDAAKEIALADAGLTAEQTGKVRARYSEKDDTPVYRVRFTVEGTSYSYKIDAETGAVLEKETGSAAEEHSHSKKGGRKANAEAGTISDQAAKVNNA